MGKPAGRLGDVSTHGGTLVLGAPNVLIGKMPAGTLGDMHVCPMVTGVVPHVGGPVALGSFGVMLGKKPAARVSDLSPCVGPPDMLAMGCMTVMIGEVGAGGGGGSAASAAAAKAAQQNGPKTIKPFDPIEPAEPRTENHFVECTVVDTAGLSLQGLRYRLTDPDGKKVVGAVAAGGRIRHDGYSQAGSFKVELACLANVKWSKTKCKPNEKLTLRADAEGFEPNTPCAVMIFEAMGNGNQRMLKHIDAKVEGKKVSVEWALTTEDLAKVHSDVPKSKVEYFFILVVDGIVGVSNTMQCLDKANIELIDPDEKAMADAKYELHLRDGSIRSGKTDKQGKAEEKDVTAGPYTLVLPEIVIHGKVPKKDEKSSEGPEGKGKIKGRSKQKNKARANDSDLDSNSNTILDTSEESKPKWMEVAEIEAKKWKGESEEIISRTTNYHKEVGVHLNDLVGTDHAWCASFVNYCIKRAGYPTTSAPARARSFLTDSNFVEIKKPVYGAIAVIGTHHVCFVYSKLSNSSRMVVLGGNQSDQINFTVFNESTRYFLPKSFDQSTGSNNALQSSTPSDLNKLFGIKSHKKTGDATR